MFFTSNQEPIKEDCHTDYVGLAEAYLQLLQRLACIEPG